MSHSEYVGLFEEAASRFPKKLAVVDGRLTHTFEELYELFQMFMRDFQAHGWAEKTITLYARSSAVSMAAALAALQSGCTLVLVHHSYSVTNLQQKLLRTGCMLLVSDVPVPEIASDLQGLCRVDAGHKTVFEFSGKKTPQAVAAVPGVACIFFTSGSTSDPKGVCVSDANMVAAFEAVTGYMRNTPDDVILHYTALGLDLGFHNSMFSLLFGGTNVVGGQAPSDPASMLKTIEEWGVTGLQALPGQLYCLAQPVDFSAYDLGALRYVSSTGQALPTNHIRNIRKWLPNTALYSMYGMTECKRILYLDPDEVDQRPTSVGKPVPGVTTYLVHRGVAGLELAKAGTTGELAVASDQVMQGYWRNQQATQNVLHENVLGEERLLLTGDLFSQDDDGFLYHVARVDDQFPRNTWMVNPREVETVIGCLSDVLESRVVPQPSTREGNIPVAYVVPHKEADWHTLAETVRSHCVANLDPHMVPAEVKLLDVLPRTISGKITAPHHTGNDK